MDSENKARDASWRSRRRMDSEITLRRRMDSEPYGGGWTVRSPYGGGWIERSRRSCTLMGNGLIPRRVMDTEVTRWRGAH